MTWRRPPRRLAASLGRARLAAEPQTLLAAVQSAWPEVAGQLVAAESRPVAERDGTVTIACRSASWAQELDLMQAELAERLSGALAKRPRPVLPQLAGLRFTADLERHTFA